jgi:hypothetical protein
MNDTKLQILRPQIIQVQFLHWQQTMQDDLKIQITMRCGTNTGKRQEGWIAFRCLSIYSSYVKVE